MNAGIDVLALPAAEAAYDEASGNDLRAFQQGEIGFQEWKGRQKAHCEKLFDVRVKVAG